MKKYSGVLFIGDPHITNASPKRRVEEDFLSVSTDKLKQSLSIAKEKNLFPVCLGDIVNKAYEYEVVVPLMEVLEDDKGLLMLLGNHDVNVQKIFNFKGRNKEQEESDKINFGDKSITIPIDNKSTVGILQKSGYLDIVNYLQERHVYLDNNTLVRLLMVPYGVHIPDVYPEYEGDFDGNIINVMVTHHDLNFGVGIQYPNSMKIFPIENCDMVVNGHIHDCKPVQEVGGTRWFNPGNILRTAKSNMDISPAVYSISDDSLEISQHKLVVKPKAEIYLEDMKYNNEELSEETLKDLQSQFVEQLRDMGDIKTDDASGIQEIIDEVVHDSSISMEARNTIYGLYETVKSES